MTSKAGVALVTGAARRIGAAIAADLAANGWAVAIHFDRSKIDAEALARRIVAGGGRAAAFQADLAQPAHAAGLVASAARALGPVTLLVNNAALFEKDEIGSLDLALFQRQLSINLTTPVFLAEAMAERLPKRATGNIVNLIDQRVLKPTPQFFSYQLSKSALWTATVTLAQALAPRIRVNAIAPGPSMRSIRQSAADFRRQSKAVPLGHGPAVEEFGRAVRFLVETGSMTGQMLLLDGGQHLAWQTPDVTQE